MMNTRSGRPRGVVLPAAAYTPPPEVARPAGDAHDKLATTLLPDGSAEINEREVTLPTANGGMIVFGTTKRWRAIDVFLDTQGYIIPAVQEAAHIGLSVWAVTRGMRVPVASGRFCRYASLSATASATNAPARAQWLVAHRGQAERFEVALFTNYAAAADTKVRVSMIASDQAVEPPSGVGVMPLSDDGGLITTDNQVHSVAGPLAFDAGIQLVGVNAALKTGVAARWLHVKDITDVVVASIPIVDQTFIGGDALRSLPAGSRFQAVKLLLSTTYHPTTLALAGDAAFNGWIR